MEPSGSLDSTAPLAPPAHSAATVAAANRQQTNLIWERTQAAIAVVTTLAYIAAQLSGRGLTAEGLANAFFLVIGFYFGRTNHARPGVGGGPARLEGDPT